MLNQTACHRVLVAVHHRNNALSALSYSPAEAIVAICELRSRKTHYLTRNYDATLERCCRFYVPVTSDATELHAISDATVLATCGWLHVTASIDRKTCLSTVDQRETVIEDLSSRKIMAWNSSCTDVLSTGIRNSWLKRIAHGKPGKIEEMRSVSNKYI